MAAVEAAAGRRFGDPSDPLLVSVRSGAPVSMPGMMDTILDLGLNDATEAGLARVSGDAAFARSCRERFEASFRSIVGVADVPDDPWLQLRLAIEAVFRSWNSDRAVAYRRKEGIADDLGTAVTVQAMVFGNRGADLGDRRPVHAQPGDRRADPLRRRACSTPRARTSSPGRIRPSRSPSSTSGCPTSPPSCATTPARLERHYADLCDIEFTIEQGRLWMLQVRVGKRSPQAALRIAVDMAEDPAFPLSRAEAVERVAALLADPPRRRVPARGDALPLVTGLAASPGVASGPIVTSPEAAMTAADAGRLAILVRAETSPDDVHGMARAAGILTSRGGLASHAAVVARGWGIPAVVGATAVEVRDGEVVLGDRTFAAGDVITIDGEHGRGLRGRHRRDDRDRAGGADAARVGAGTGDSRRHGQA